MLAALFEWLSANIKNTNPQCKVRHFQVILFWTTAYEAYLGGAHVSFHETKQTQNIQLEAGFTSCQILSYDVMMYLPHTRHLYKHLCNSIMQAKCLRIFSPLLTSSQHSAFRSMAWAAEHCRWSRYWMLSPAVLESCLCWSCSAATCRRWFTTRTVPWKRPWLSAACSCCFEDCPTVTPWASYTGYWMLQPNYFCYSEANTPLPFEMYYEEQVLQADNFNKVRKRALSRMLLQRQPLTQCGTQDMLTFQTLARCDVVQTQYCCNIVPTLLQHHYNSITAALQLHYNCVTLE